MTTALGTTGQLGLARETTFGTPVTPTKWYPFDSETLDPGYDYIMSKGLRSDTGRGVLASTRGLAKQDAKGQVVMDINNKGFATLLRAALGSLATTQPASGTDPTVYDHTVIPGSTTGNEIYTLEVGFQDDAATSYKKLVTSAMVNKMDIEVKQGELAKATIDWMASSMAVAASRTAASYPASLTPFAGVLATCTLGGVSADSISAKVSIDNQLDGDRYYLGGGGARKQPIAGRIGVTAELEADFKDWTAFNRVINNTYSSLVLTLIGATISNAYKYQLQITMNVATVGTAPQLSGPGRIAQPLKLEAYDDGTGPGSVITCVYRTTDATA